MREGRGLNDQSDFSARRLQAGSRFRGPIAKAAGLLILSAFFSTLESALVRWLGESVAIGQIMLVRGGTQVILAFFAALLLSGMGLASLKTTRYGGHAARGLLACVAWWLYYKSFTLLDLALATTISFTIQLFVVLFAWPVLKERVTPRAIGAAFVGFGGVVVATRLWESGPANEGALYGLAAAALGALMILITRSLSLTEKTSTILFYMACLVTLSAIPQVLIDWRPLDAAQWTALLALGLLGTTSTMLLIDAYRLAEASRLAPYPYSRFVFAAIIGSLAFGDSLTLATLAGAALIVLSNLEPFLPGGSGRTKAGGKT